MRHLLVSLLVAFTLLLGAAPARAELAPLSAQQVKFLRGMADRLQHGLSKAHARQGARSPYEQPVVELNVSKRRLSIVNRFRENPRGKARGQVRDAVRAKVPDLCLILAPKDVRRTGLEIVMRAEMRSGSPIAKAKASPATCPL